LDIENPRRLHRIYSDVCGPFDVEEYSRCRYFVTFVDGFSHYVRIKPIRTKDKASKMLMNWITRSEVETGEQVNFLRTDGGEEYMGNVSQTSFGHISINSPSILTVSMATESP